MDGVIEEIDVEHSIYEVPLMLQREKMDALVCQELGLETSPADMSEWEAVIQRIIKPQHQVRIGVIGKYIHLQDAYKSVYEAVTHAGGANDCAIEIVRVDSEDIERDGAAALWPIWTASLCPAVSASVAWKARYWPPVRARKQRALSRPLPRHADRLR